MDDKSQLIVDSMKLLQDWSKWLVALEAGICASLWSKLTSAPASAVAKPHALLYVGWMMFWASIITAAILLVYISEFVRHANIHGERDLKRVKRLVAIEYGFFLGGLFCFAFRMVQAWLS
jgi:hypothetical protein